MKDDGADVGAHSHPAVRQPEVKDDRLPVFMEFVFVQLFNFSGLDRIDALHAVLRRVVFQLPLEENQVDGDASEEESNREADEQVQVRDLDRYGHEIEITIFKAASNCTPEFKGSGIGNRASIKQHLTNFEAFNKAFYKVAMISISKYRDFTLFKKPKLNSPNSL